MRTRFAAVRDPFQGPHTTNSGENRTSKITLSGIWFSGRRWRERELDKMVQSRFNQSPSSPQSSIAAKCEMEGEGDWGERSEIGSETTIDVAGILQSTWPKEVASEA
jgi:hypothetical protein